MTTHYSTKVTSTVIDGMTGEILSVRQEGSLRTIRKEELHYMFIFHTYGRILTKDLPRSCDYVLDMMITECIPWTDDDVRSMCVTVGRLYYQEWARKSNGEYKASTMEQCIKKMSKADVLRRVQRGMYMINPYYLFKGNLKDIKKARERWNNLTPTGKDPQRA